MRISDWSSDVCSSDLLVDYADTLSLSTLKQRLAALAQWHITQGFPDPTKTPTVRQVLKGIRTLHPAQTKQAAPLQLLHLEQAVQWLNQEAERAQQSGNLASLLRCRRDVALLLIGFWRGFRSDELCRLQVEHIQAEAGAGMRLFLPQSKGDRENLGTTHYRSEEHTSELQSLMRISYAVFCLKKKQNSHH